MKKLIVLLMALLLLLTGCVQKQTDYPAAIMVDGVVYLKSGSPMPAEIDESAIIGYTTSYTDSFPEKNGETNFSRGLDLPYAKVEGGVAILCENEWYLCTPMEQNTEKCPEDAAGCIRFYSKPIKEAQNSSEAPDVSLSRELNEEQAARLNEILDNVKRWSDDYLLDRLAYYFDGEFELSGKEHTYYFTYEYNVIYFDHYIAEIPAEDMEYIKVLGSN